MTQATSEPSHSIWPKTYEMLVQLFEYVVVFIDVKNEEKQENKSAGIGNKKQHFCKLNTIETKIKIIKMLKAANLWLELSVHWS